MRGPRQTGKSTFLRQFVQKALSLRTRPSHVGLIEAESLESRHDLFAEIEAFISNPEKRHLLLIDEISSLEKWWLALKLLADKGILANSLVVCTGSSSLDLTEGADLLPGRRGKRHPVDFELLPVRYRDVAGSLSLEDYLLTGGFPWAITEYLRRSDIPPFVYELYRAWVQGTLVKKKHSIQSLPSLLNYLAERIGTGTSVTKLSRDCGIGANRTAEALLAVLEMNYVVIPSRWSLPGSGASAPKKNRKFYPFDPLLFHLFSDFGQSMDSAFLRAQARLSDPQRMGALAEALVASELRHHRGMFPFRYYLGRREIDFVGESAVEVKYQNKVDFSEFAWVRSVLPKRMRFTVLTKQTRSTQDILRAVPLRDWLVED